MDFTSIRNTRGPGRWPHDDQGVELDLESQVFAVVPESENPPARRNDRLFANAPLSAALFDTDSEMDEESATESESSDASSSNEWKGVVAIRGVMHGSSQPKAQTLASPTSMPKGATTKFGNDKYGEHFVLFSHGKFWTVIGILFAWTGLICASDARTTTSFVTVESPIYIDSTFEEVYDVGLVNFQLCFNETTAQRSGCTVHELEVNDVNDKMFQIARSMAFLACLLGGVLAACMTISIVWHSINLKPIGKGLLLTYFCQSFTFLFFDSRVCGMHKCSLSQGSINSIIACFCWILAAIAAARMDAYKDRKMKEREMAERRRKTSKLDRGISNVTHETEDSNESDESMQAVSGRPRREGPKISLICGIDDRRASKAWEARLHRSDDRSAGRRDDRRNGRSRSLNPSSRHLEGTGRTLERLMQAKSVHDSQFGSTDTRPPRVTTMTRHPTSNERITGISPKRPLVGESPGRRALRSHSLPKRSRGIDSRTFDL